MVYRKLKRVWSHGYGNYIPNFDKVFPELKNLSSEEMCDRWQTLNIEFYSEEITPVKRWVRLTLPFGLLTIAIMFIGLPVCFMISGEWNYNLKGKNHLYNWLKSLKLL